MKLELKSRPRRYSTCGERVIHDVAVGTALVSLLLWLRRRTTT